jgi:hypothetical protein
MIIAIIAILVIVVVIFKWLESIAFGVGYKILEIKWSREKYKRK